MQILEGKNVTKHFGGLAAVHEVNFDIHQGEVVGLIGPNGAGNNPFQFDLRLPPDNRRRNKI